MLLKFFTLFDSKAAIYNRPFLFKSSAEAIRSFGDICNDDESLCGKHPSDFTLFEIGDFDDQTGHIGSGLHTSLGTGNDYKKET